MAKQSNTKQLAQLFPNCYSVAYRNSAYLIYHKYKTNGDQSFIQELFDNQDIENLKYMEAFYNQLRKDRTCEKDIMSRTYCSPLKAEMTKSRSRKKVSLEDT